MRINLNPKTQEATVGQATQPSTRPSSTAGGTAGITGDTAELSLEQAKVQSLTAEANRVPDVRQDKVTALGLAIQQGSYDVTPEQTAEAIIGEMQTRFAA